MPLKGEVQDTFDLLIQNKKETQPPLLKLFLKLLLRPLLKPLHKPPLHLERRSSKRKRRKRQQLNSLLRRTTQLLHASRTSRRPARPALSRRR